MDVFQSSRHDLRRQLLAFYTCTRRALWSRSSWSRRSGKLWKVNLPIQLYQLDIAKNRIAQYMGPASAYAAVLSEIEADSKHLMKANPNLFTFKDIGHGTCEIRDFQTTGVVAFAKGSPFSRLSAGKQDIGGHRVQVKEDYRKECLKNITLLAAML
jgi:hypothetical protein